MIEITRQGTIVEVCLRRHPVNAIDEDMLVRLREAVADIRQNSDTTVLLLRGEGRVFCAGADIRMLRDALEAGNSERMLQFTRAAQALKNDIEALSCITIAAIHGAATGGGLELALACDFRVCGTDARLGLPEIKLGLLPAAGGTQRLTRLIGAGNASRMILSGDLLSGAEAARIGLVQWAVTNGEVLEFARSLAQQVMNHPKSAIAGGKRCIAAASGDRMAGFQTEVQCQETLLASPRTIELLRAFLDHRKDS